MCISFPSTVQYITYKNIKYTETLTTALSNSNLTLYNTLHAEPYAILQSSTTVLHIFTNPLLSHFRPKSFSVYFTLQGLRAFHVTQSWAIALTPFHPVPLSLKIFCKLSSPSVLGTSFGSFHLYSSLSSNFWVSLIPILTTCPNQLNCANSIIYLWGIIPNPILTV